MTNEDNSFKLAGKVAWIGIKHNSDTGKPTTTIRLDKKQLNGTYMNLFIKFHNTKNRNTADIMMNEIQKDDLIRVNGQITSYKDKNTKEEKIQLIGWGYKKIEWDPAKKKFVDVEDEQPDDTYEMYDEY